jgi:hypothetical protein
MKRNFKKNVETFKFIANYYSTSSLCTKLFSRKEHELEFPTFYKILFQIIIIIINKFNKRILIL